MAEPTDAPTPAPAEASVETPTNTNTEPVKAPETTAPKIDLGLSEEQAQKFKTFIDNSGGFDNAFKKLKTDISSPKEEVQQPQTQPEQKKEESTSHTEEPKQMPQTPQGAITAQEFLAKQYFKSLAGEEKYAPISKGIENGDYLKEMAAFGINALNQDGSINDQKVRMYLDLKAQTVPAKPTESEPNASAAPTVNYTEVGENGITDINQAYKILMEKGNPSVSKAEEFIKNHFNPNSGKK